MDHPNCIRLYSVFVTPKKVFIVTELVAGGELLDRCGAPWRYCHHHGIKIENLVYYSPTSLSPNW